MKDAPGRYCELAMVPEVAELQAGMDFRLPRYRREVFLRFYEFHLRHRAHPGCVYYLLPHLAEVGGWSMEQRLWFAFINGNTQNPVTSWLIFREFPDLARLDGFRLAEWFGSHYQQLAFDTDRRYHKAKFLVCVENYRVLTGGDQVGWLASLTAPTPEATFRALWQVVVDRFIYFGRLSAFSYLEYLAISGVPLACDQLFLRDLPGSRSHRNGLCRVLGRDDLDWHDSNPAFDGDYSGVMDWLVAEGEALLHEAQVRLKPSYPDVGNFTLESALCTYKSWHRPNRRYPNVYNDMLVDRIRLAERDWGFLPVFWQARERHVQVPLRRECCFPDVGVKPVKQNWYRQTGQIIHMDLDWPCFANDYHPSAVAIHERFE